MKWLICETLESWNALLGRIEAYRGIPNSIWARYANPIQAIDGYVMPIIDEVVVCLSADEAAQLIDYSQIKFMETE